MRKIFISICALFGVGVGAALLMAPTGGYPFFPKFGAVGIGTAPGGAGTLVQYSLAGQSNIYTMYSNAGANQFTINEGSAGDTALIQQSGSSDTFCIGAGGSCELTFNSAGVGNFNSVRPQIKTVPIPTVLYGSCTAAGSNGTPISPTLTCSRQSAGAYTITSTATYSTAFSCVFQADSEAVTANVATSTTSQWVDINFSTVATDAVTHFVCTGL